MLFLSVIPSNYTMFLVGSCLSWKELLDMLRQKGWWVRRKLFLFSVSRFCILDFDLNMRATAIGFLLEACRNTTCKRGWFLCISSCELLLWFFIYRKHVNIAWGSYVKFSVKWEFISLLLPLVIFDYLLREFCLIVFIIIQAFCFPFDHLN